MEKEITIWSYKLPALFVYGAGFLLVVPAFWESTPEFIQRRENQEEYSHGDMNPIVSAYLIWQRREILSHIDSKQTWLPIGLVFSGLVLAVIREISALYILVPLYQGANRAGQRQSSHYPEWPEQTICPDIN